MFYGLLMGDRTVLLLIPAIILSIVASIMVNSAYRRYSEVPTKNGLTGSQAAMAIMRANGLNIPIRQIPGELTDNYNPLDKSMNLSGPVALGTSIASVGVAAHETGHALQDAEGYFPLRLRRVLVPVSNFATNAGIILFFIGLIFAAESPFGTMLMNVGIIFFSASLLVSLITLPVEFNASRRAVKVLREQGLLEEDEIYGVKKVLRAAALTYVAAALTSLMSLIRLLVIRGNRN